MTATRTAQEITIGTTIHDELVVIVLGRRYASVRQEGQSPRPFATEKQAFDFAHLLVPAHRRTTPNPHDLGRFSRQSVGIAAARRVGLVVVESPYAWQAPATSFGPATYELRQLSPEIYEWVLS